MEPWMGYPDQAEQAVEGVNELLNVPVKYIGQVAVNRSKLPTCKQST